MLDTALYIAGLLAVERTTYFLRSDRRFHPICGTNPGDKSIPCRTDRDGGVLKLQEGF
jgi:hypothetical protein